MKPINLVVLDDEQNILNSMNRLFRGEEFGVFTTTDHKEALEIMDKEHIKLVISDYKMPEITGTEFLNMVREKHPEVLRILFTGYTDIHIAEDAINKGEVYRFINKPWEDMELKTTVKEAIHRYDLSEKNRVLTHELAEQNEKLQYMYEMQKEFTSTVSHELRTPLASIKTMLDIIMSGTAGELTEQQKTFLGKTKANVDRLNRLINDILDLSRMERGKQTFNFIAQDMESVINDVVDVQKPVAEDKGLYVKTDIAEGMPKVAYDNDKMNQVFNNLIGNSIKFTNEGGITVKAAYDAERKGVTVAVIDTGAGISEEDRPKLFEKFQQLGDPALRKAGGTGLGLSICKEIIDRHQGEIWVESEQGKGSTFAFFLPTEHVDDDF